MMLGGKWLAQLSRRAFSSQGSSAYAILGVPRNASAATIRSKYLQLAKSLHPDSGGPKDGSFADVSAAYDVLSSPTRRAAHDRELEAKSKSRVSEVIALALALANCGRVRTAVAVFLTIGEVDEHALNPSIALARSLLNSNTQYELLEPATHAQAKTVWEWLLLHNGVDSDTCNTWFALCLHRGHHVEAMQAYKHARREGLEQSVLMQSTARQALLWAHSSNKRGA